MRDGEVVGLAADNNGRSCAKHECCGEHVFVGDLVQFKKTLVWYNGKLDEAVKVVLIKNKKETCTVAFMPRNIAYARANEFHMSNTVLLLTTLNSTNLKEAMPLFLYDFLRFCELSDKWYNSKILPNFM